MPVIGFLPMAIFLRFTQGCVWGDKKKFKPHLQKRTCSASPKSICPTPFPCPRHRRYSFTGWIERCMFVFAGTSSLSSFCNQPWIFSKPHRSFVLQPVTSSRLTGGPVGSPFHAFVRVVFFCVCSIWLLFLCLFFRVFLNFVVKLF